MKISWDIYDIMSNIWEIQHFRQEFDRELIHEDGEDGEDSGIMVDKMKKCQASYNDGHTE